MPTFNLCGNSKSNHWCFNSAQHKSPTWLLWQNFTLKIVHTLHSKSFMEQINFTLFLKHPNDANTKYNRNYKVFLQGFVFFCVCKPLKFCVWLLIIWTCKWSAQSKLYLFFLTSQVATLFFCQLSELTWGTSWDPSAGSQTGSFLHLFLSTSGARSALECVKRGNLITVSSSEAIQNYTQQSSILAEWKK